MRLTILCGWRLKVNFNTLDIILSNIFPSGKFAVIRLPKKLKYDLEMRLPFGSITLKDEFLAFLNDKSVALWINGKVQRQDMSPLTSIISATFKWFRQIFATLICASIGNLTSTNLDYCTWDNHPGIEIVEKFR